MKKRFSYIFEIFIKDYQKRKNVEKLKHVQTVTNKEMSINTIHTGTDQFGMFDELFAELEEDFGGDAKRLKEKE